MINTNERLTILHSDNGVFVDGSANMASFSRDSAVIDYEHTEDSMYIGFYKPINALYFDFIKASNQMLTLEIRYFNGTEFAALPSFIDDTAVMTRSGFVAWERNLSDEAKTTVNGIELYWYKFDLIGSTHQFEVNGINIVFSDDTDLKREFFEVNQFLPAGQSSHIMTHEAARDEIIQALNQKSEQIIDGNTGWEKNISAFDLLNVGQIKLASTYLVLSKIFLNVSDEVDDLYMEKSKIYRSKYNDIINNVTLEIDHDDDGKYDRIERNTFSYGLIKRL